MAGEVGLAAVTGPAQVPADVDDNQTVVVATAGVSIRETCRKRLDRDQRRSRRGRGVTQAGIVRHNRSLRYGPALAGAAIEASAILRAGAAPVRVAPRRLTGDPRSGVAQW